MIQTKTAENFCPAWMTFQLGKQMANKVLVNSPSVIVLEASEKSQVGNMGKEYWAGGGFLLSSLLGVQGCSHWAYASE